MDVDGISIMTGLAWSRQTELGTLLLAAFFEGGWGTYDSHNSFSTAASVGGSGDTEYLGGGLLGRIECPLGGTGSTDAAQRSKPETMLSGAAIASATQDVRPSVIYTKFSFRMGRVKTDFASGDLRDGMGTYASYDRSSLYYGAHLGWGMCGISTIPQSSTSTPSISGRIRTATR